MIGSGRTPPARRAACSAMNEPDRRSVPAPIATTGLLTSFCAVGAVASLVVHAVALLGLEGRAGASATTAAWTLAGVVGVAATAAAARRSADPRRQRALALVAVAIAVWSLGAALRLASALLDLDWPLIAAEVLWCGFAVIMIAALVVRAPAHAFTMRLFVLDAIPIVLVSIQIARIVSDTGFHAPLPDQLFVTAYASLYLLLVVVAAQLILIASQRDLPLYGFVAASALIGAAGLIWALDPRATRIDTGDATDPLWSVGVLLLAAGALLRARSPAVLAPPEEPKDAGFRAVPPALALGALIIMIEIVPKDRFPLTFWFTAISFIAVAARYYLARRDSRSLLERESEARAAAQMSDEMKDEFLALVSHELRTPLTSIRGYLELVLEEPDELSEEQLRFLRTVERNSDRLLRLVSDLLFVAEIEAMAVSIAPEPVSVDRLAEESVDSAAPAAEAGGIALVLKAGARAEINADRARLGQLLDNLVSNALKFTPAGGRVVVKTMREDGLAVIEVRDTGMGIPADEQEQLFERFFRTRAATERAIQGTGLGLTIARAIAEAHGGRIEFESAEGVGTVFRVQLPLRS